MQMRLFIMLIAATVVVGVTLCTALSFDNEDRIPNEPGLLSALQPGKRVILIMPSEGRSYRIEYAEPEQKGEMIMLKETGAPAWTVTHVSEEYIALIDPSGEWEWRLRGSDIESIRVYRGVPAQIAPRRRE